MKTIIFDLGETLLYFRDRALTGDIENESNYCINEVLDYLNKRGVSQIKFKDIKNEINKLRIKKYKNDIEIHIDNLGSSLSEIYGLNKKITKDIIHIFSSKYFDSLYLDPNTHEVLSKLSKTYKLGILSNSPFGIDSQYSIAAMIQFDILKYFNFYGFSVDFGVRKPNAKFFDLVLSKYHIKKNECLFIGNDEKNDIEGARMAGIDKVIKIKQLDEEDSTGTVLSEVPEYILNNFINF
ncbi:HAD family hydrolase [Candidatus Dojkabacteria bacterium]|uniref:HAD family hydrolase n=1 Tax=Candidatus Dojkabacteria bacterium TaxID=2099670 RepID=A0A955I8V4_9BACT|nr:HAD family hydrolase [Candidatus Dojkabacteria bacterium]